MLRARRRRPRVHRDALGVPLRAGQGRAAGRQARRRRARRSRPSSTSCGTSSTPRSAPARHLMADRRTAATAATSSRSSRWPTTGLFGEVTNGHGGYLHDLRALLFCDTYYTDSWRRRLAHPQHRQSFYAMHGLAPIAAADGRQPRRPLDHAEARPRPQPKGLADYRERFMPPRVTRSWNEDVHQRRPRHLHDRRPPTAGSIRAEHDGQRAAPVQPYQQPCGQPWHLRGLRRHFLHGRPGLLRARPQR